VSGPDETIAIALNFLSEISSPFGPTSAGSAIAAV
jgi:hypothetical protein